MDKAMQTMMDNLQKNTGKTLEQFRTDFARLVGDVDDDALREVLERCLQYGALRGLATQAD